MCKIVYLTTRRFDRASKLFRDALANELRNRGVEVVTENAFDIFNRFRQHRTYGIAMAFDFYRDGKQGSGLTLNKNCSYIGRDFAYNLSNDYDRLTPMIRWRDLEFVDSDNKRWFRFFNKVSASTKAIFYLCTINNEYDWNNYNVVFPDVVKLFADEIIRCLRSNYNVDNYRQRVKSAKLKIHKVQE